jgi:hypothetical protein
MKITIKEKGTYFLLIKSCKALFHKVIRET